MHLPGHSHVWFPLQLLVPTVSLWKLIALQTKTHLLAVDASLKKCLGER